MQKNSPLGLPILILLALIWALGQPRLAAQGDHLVYLPHIVRRGIPHATTTPSPTVSPMATATHVPTATRTPTPISPPLVITSIRATTDDEYITIRNTTSVAQPLAGWRLQSWDATDLPCTPEPDQVYPFPLDFTLAPGASVRVHSGPTGGDLPRTLTDLPWTTRYTWNNDGDRGDLINPADQLVSTYAYGVCRS